MEQSAILFNIKGYAGTSLNDVCERTGLTKGAIYAYYKDKEDLAVAALDFNTEKILSGFRHYAARVENIPARIVALAEFYKENFQQLFSEGGCPFLSAATEFDDQPGRIADQLKDGFAAWKQGFMDIMEDGIQKGQVPAGINKEKYASLFIAMIEGGIMMTQLYKSPEVLGNIFEQIHKITLSEIMISQPQQMN